MFGDVLPDRPFLYSVDADGITITRFNDNAVVGTWTWPDSQQVIEALWGHIPNDELRMMLSGNAAELYRHPLPEVVLPQD